MVTSHDHRAAVIAVSTTLPLHTDRLNAADADLGDGDLGSTLNSVACELRAIAPALPDDIGAALASIARTIGGVSGSSFSGVVMAGLLRASTLAKGKREVGREELVELLLSVVAAMSRRGGAALGDKTVLDGLDTIAAAWSSHNQPDGLAAVARGAAAIAIESFRQRPSQVGRARLAGERSIGRDDPGMVVLQIATEAIASTTATGARP